jgi:hypothetical protein
MAVPNRAATAVRKAPFIVIKCVLITQFQSGLIIIQQELKLGPLKECPLNE